MSNPPSGGDGMVDIPPVGGTYHILGGEREADPLLLSIPTAVPIIG